METMTIKPVALRPARALIGWLAGALLPVVRPALPLALALAYCSTLWLQLLHQVSGATEHNEPAGLVHWLRDATLVLPVIFVAVVAALFLVRRLLHDAGRHSTRRERNALAVATTAVAASAAVALSSPIHGLLFAGHDGAHEGLSLVQHMVQNGLLALVANLLIVSTVWKLAGTRPFRDGPAPRPMTGERRGLRLAANGLMALMLLPALTGLTPAGPAPVRITPATSADVAACLSGAAAADKSFDVQAIDVDIPLNRFGDHDPSGKMFVLTPNLAAVRAAERSRQVSAGLRDDPIQPLVIRANMGDCVEITFTNNASGGDYGVHIDGLAFDAASSGDAVGNNSSSAVARGGSRTYRYWVPVDPALEGAHYLRPGPGNRAAVAHGLFGALAVEPTGSTYWDANTPNTPILSGWEATIVPASGKAFRENVQLYHEIGNESEKIFTKDGKELPTNDPHTEAYRPGSRGINYRTEPFFNRLNAAPEQESQGYGSYTFGDPATVIPRGYVGDPTKFRIMHAGSEMFHVFHMHGGGIRWRFNPHADPTYNYADTGLNKTPVPMSDSERLDSQSIGPGESYDLEIECGAGGCQQGAGEFLFHCHIGPHYIAGMWGFWRVYNTLQPDLVPLPDRNPAPAAVDSAGLLGKTMPDGTVLTAANLESWIRPQLPPPGVRLNDQDATVWDWTVDGSNPAAPVYLGEPEDLGPWPDLPNLVPGHPGSYLVDQMVGHRPKILFNPMNGRPAFPLMRTHVGMRPPFAPNGHSGAPYLGENANASAGGSPDPWADRADGLCPSHIPMKHFNVVAIETPIQVTKDKIDPLGKIFVLAKNVAATRADPRAAEPLAIRINTGECGAVTLTSEETDKNAFGGFAKVNIHIHHVQFDTQASDGVITGMSFEQSVRPYKLEDTQLTAVVQPGQTVLSLATVAPKLRPGVWIALGEGTESIEVRQIRAVDAAAKTVTLAQPAANAHASGDWAGTEFTQYRWFADVQLDNIFCHDHVDGIHNWGHGLVCQLIVEPAGSTYHDPKTGAPVDSGTIVDIHTSNPLAPSFVTGSFRELALWTIDENPIADGTLNLRAEPWKLRSGDPSLRFSSYTSGDPITPLPRAYPGDPVVIRTINVSSKVDGLHVDGGRFYLENRYLDANGKEAASPLNTLHYGVSERYTLVLDDGSGRLNRKPGDYLYLNTIGRHFRDGAWGIIRVLPGLVPDLQPLPGNTPAEGTALPAPTGGRPPVASDPGNPCPAGAPLHQFAVSAIDLPSSSWGGGRDGRKTAFVPTALASSMLENKLPVEPLVLHVSEGECVTVNFTNQRHGARASFHLDGLQRDPASSGINIGFSPEQTVAPDQSRTYRFYADTSKIGSTLISDFGGDDSGRDGLYGAMVVAPYRASFTDPMSGRPTDVGAQVDVQVSGAPGYRDFTVIFTERDPEIGQNHMPYPTQVAGPALVNYRTAGQRTDGAMFSSRVHGDPTTPMLRAYAGDPVQVHALLAPGNEQSQTFNLGGHSWLIDPALAVSQQVQTRALSPWGKVDAPLMGGAGGPTAAVGDYFYGMLRRPFTEAGMWGILRVLPAPAPEQCSTAAGTLRCLGQ